MSVRPPFPSGQPAVVRPSDAVVLYWSSSVLDTIVPPGSPPGSWPCCGSCCSGISRAGPPSGCPAGAAAGPSGLAGSRWLENLRHVLASNLVPDRAAAPILAAALVVKWLKAPFVQFTMLPTLVLTVLWVVATPASAPHPPAGPSPPSPTAPDPPQARKPSKARSSVTPAPPGGAVPRSGRRAHPEGDAQPHGAPPRPPVSHQRGLLGGVGLDEEVDGHRGVALGHEDRVHQPGCPGLALHGLPVLLVQRSLDLVLHAGPPRCSGVLSPRSEDVHHSSSSCRHPAGREYGCRDQRGSGGAGGRCTGGTSSRVLTPHPDAAVLEASPDAANQLGARVETVRATEALSRHARRELDAIQYAGALCRRSSGRIW